MASKIDILISGGGMVGLTLAAALAELDLRLIVLEKSSLDDLLQGDYLNPSTIEASDYGLRVSAINPGNQRWLNTLDIWSQIPASRRADFERMAVWDADGSGAVNFDAAEIGQPFLGSIVENSVLRAAAWQRLSKLDNVEIRSGVSIKELHTDEQHIDVELDNGQHIRAKLLIGADGAVSTVRRLLQIPSFEVAYRQSAFVATVETEKNHQATAWQRFTRTGPVAFLPLPQANLCSVVWSLDDDRAATVNSLNREQFAEQLNRAFECRLGDISLKSEFATFPLFKRHSERYLAPRCVLVGDAAHTIHPLAGQGVNLGFQDAAALTQQITTLIKHGRDYTLMANLRPYERQRKAANYLMQNAMSGFKWLFGEPGLLPTLLRNSMLSAADQSGPIKQLIMRNAIDN